MADPGAERIPAPLHASSGSATSLPLALGLLLLVALTFAFGAHVARTQPIDRAEYTHNFHHHELDRRLANPPGFDFFQLWGYGDAQFYLSIAARGYPARDQFRIEEPPRLPRLLERDQNAAKWAFIPAWPLAIRAGSWLLGDLDHTALVLANLCSLAAFLLLQRYLAPRHGEAVAAWTVILLATYPMGLFYNVPYTESLFLLLVVLTFHATAAHRLELAALAIGIAAITRPFGIALVLIPVAVFVRRWWAARRIDWREARSLLWLAMAALPLLAWMAWNQRLTGDPLFFVHVRGAWHEYPGDSPWLRLYKNTWGSLAQFNDFEWHRFRSSKVDVLSMVGALALLLLTLRVAPLEYAVYAAIGVLVPLLAKHLMSYCRHVIVVWPLFFTLAAVVPARWRNLILGPLALVFLVLRFDLVGQLVRWRWVG